MHKQTKQDIHTTEYYSALGRHKIDTWVNLEGIMLSEISQAQKGRFCVIPLIYGTLE